MDDEFDPDYCSTTMSEESLRIIYRNAGNAERDRKRTNDCCMSNDAVCVYEHAQLVSQTMGGRHDA